MIMVGKKKLHHKFSTMKLYSVVTVLHRPHVVRCHGYWGGGQLHRQLLCLEIHPSTRYQVTNSRGVDVVLSVADGQNLA
jgi:hypothetical protein